VAVELYLGRLDADGEFTDGVAPQMLPVSRANSGRYIFEAKAVDCCTSGLHGYTVRILPCHRDLTVPFLPALITWAEPQ
jgi:starch phosphorylase